MSSLLGNAVKDFLGTKSFYTEKESVACLSCNLMLFGLFTIADHFAIQAKYAPNPPWGESQGEPTIVLHCFITLYRTAWCFHTN